jgi:hypothetical protein
MNRFILQNTFIKVYICWFLTNIFIKKKKSKLYFGDRVAVLNDFIYQTGGITGISSCFSLRPVKK